MSEVQNSYRYVYVLTSLGADIFSNLTYVSISVLLYVTPKSEIIIYCEEETLVNLKKVNHPLLSLELQLITKENPYPHGVYSNRFMKCNLRNWVEGPFIYLDADTLIKCNFTNELLFQEDIALVSNHSTIYPENFDNRERAIFEKFSWPLPNGIYFNAGVQYWNDTPATREMADLYLRKWKQCADVRIHFDQPAFNSAIIDSKINVLELPNAYNAQYHTDLRVAIDAKVWHKYLSQKSRSPKDYFDLMLEHVANYGKISKPILENLIQSCTPLMVSNPQREKRIIAYLNQNDGVIKKSTFYKMNTSIYKRLLKKGIKLIRK